MQRLSFVYIILTLACCSSNDKGTGNGILQNRNPNLTTISIYQPKPIDVKSLFSEIGFIKLDTAANAFMTNPSCLRVYKEHIYLCDGGPPESVLIFDMSGAFIRRVGTIGRGPREMLTMRHIEIDYVRDRLYITDSFGRQSLSFDLEGNYLFTVPLGDYGGFIAISPLGNIVHESSSSMFGLDIKTMVQRENIKILDTLGNLIAKGFDYNYNRSIFQEFRTLSVSKSGNITFAPLFRDTIYSVTESSITPVYAFNFSKVKGISKQRSDTYLSAKELTKDLEINGYVCLAGAHLDTPDVFYAQLGFSPSSSHLFYQKSTNETHIVRLYNYKFENGVLPIKNVTLFNGTSSALIPCNIEDYYDGHFYGVFNEVQQIILKNLNPDEGTIERQLLDSIEPEESNMYIIYLKFKNQSGIVDFLNHSQ